MPDATTENTAGSQPPTPETGPQGPLTWREIGRDLLRPTRSQLAIAAILLFCGLALTMQLSTRAEQRYTNLRQDDLVAILDDVTAETRRLESEIAELELTKARLQSGADASAVARAEAKERLDALELLGGTVRAQGPGIRVTIVDQAGKVTPEIFLNALGELRDAGAEVIEVNDKVRLVAGSWVEAGKGGLVVDGVQLASPYVLESIGDPDTLAEATRFRGGLVSTIEGERVNGSATVVKVTDLRIDTVRAARTNRYARPV